MDYPHRGLRINPSNNPHPGSKSVLRVIKTVAPIATSNRFYAVSSTCFHPGRLGLPCTCSVCVFVGGTCAVALNAFTVLFLFVYA